jgi:hypothetical protein
MGEDKLPLLPRHTAAEIREMIMEGGKERELNGGNNLDITIIYMFSTTLQGLHSLSPAHCSGLGRLVALVTDVGSLHTHNSIVSIGKAYDTETNCV